MTEPKDLVLLHVHRLDQIGKCYWLARSESAHDVIVVDNVAMADTFERDDVVSITIALAANTPANIEVIVCELKDAALPPHIAAMFKDA